MINIGIDFGTTHTSAAFFDGETIRAIPLDAHNANPNLLRSMIYITREQQCYLGLEAIQRFLAQDTGRAVVSQKKVVGAIEYTVAQQYKGSLEPDGPITMVQDVLIEEDVGAHGRLLQSIKTELRSELYQGTQIFRRYYSLQELIALLLRHVRVQAETTLQQEVRQATLGRPVQFSSDPAADQRAQQRLSEAARLAGFTQVDFVPEPVAAASFYLNQLTKPETLLVFDFGGGTLDLTILRVDGKGQRSLLATHGVLVGGDDLDSQLMHHLVAPSFGAASPMDVNFDGRPLPFPEDLAIQLDQWQTIPLLSRQQPLALIRRAKKYSPERHKFAALECLATQNHGFALFQEIEETQCTLSERQQTELIMRVADINLALVVTRPEFNQAINDALSQARQGVRKVLRLAGVPASAIDTVVTTGGSSVIPLFQQMLRYECPSSRLAPVETFTGVTSGLALHAFAQSVVE